jgi:anti-anti-sigma regulatory factor
MTTVFNQINGILKIAGDLRIDDVSQLHEILRECAFNQAELSLDLAEVTACDTASLQLLMSALKTAATLGKPFRIVAASQVFSQNSAALAYLSKAPNHIPEYDLAPKEVILA